MRASGKFRGNDYRFVPIREWNDKHHEAIAKRAEGRRREAPGRHRKDPRYLVTTGNLKLTTAELRIEIEVAPTFLTEGNLLCTIKVGQYGRSSVYVWLSGGIPEVFNRCTRGDEMIQTNKQTNSAQEKIFLNWVVTKRCYQSSLRCPRFADNVQEDSHGRAVTWAAMIVLAMYHLCFCLLCEPIAMCFKEWGLF